MLNEGNLEPEDRAGITQNLSMLNVTWDTTLNHPIYSSLKYGLGRGDFVLLASYLIPKNKGKGGVGGRLMTSRWCGQWEQTHWAQETSGPCARGETVVVGWEGSSQPPTRPNLADLRSNGQCQ